MDKYVNWVKIDTVEKLAADLNMTIQELEVQLALGSIRSSDRKILERFNLSTTSIKVMRRSGLSRCILALAKEIILPRTKVVGFSYCGEHLSYMEVGGLAERIKPAEKGRIHYMITQTGIDAAEILSGTNGKPMVSIPVKINLARYYHYAIAKGK